MTPGSIAKLAILLQEHGVQSQMEVHPADSTYFTLYRVYLLLCNTVVYLTKTAAIFFYYASRQSTSHTSTSTSVGLPGRVNLSTMTQGEQQTVQSVSAVPNGGHQPNNALSSVQAIATQHQQTLESSRDDYMLLCSDDNSWLTTRDDLNVSQIRSDRELFDAFQSRLKERKRWARRFASLKSIQRISFVKVSNFLYLCYIVCKE
jgi:hypothetical protein